MIDVVNTAFGGDECFLVESIHGDHYADLYLILTIRLCLV